MRAGDFCEQRRFIRFNIKTHINFQIRRPGEAALSPDRIAAITKDLSMKGVSFSSKRKLIPGSILKLYIFLEQQAKPLHMEGRVMWCRLQPAADTFDTGVELLSVDKADEKAFLSYIRKRAREEKE